MCKLKSARLVEKNYQWEILVEFDVTGWPITNENCIAFALTNTETNLALNISLYGTNDPVVREQLRAWVNNRLSNEQPTT